MKQADTGKNQCTGQAGFWWAVVAALFIASFIGGIFPGIDLYVSNLFYSPTGGFIHSRLLTAVHNFIPFFLIASALVSAMSLALKKIISLKGMWFIIINFLLGPGLVINVLLKGYYGRARPWQIEQFGGHLHFTSALTITDQCYHNCSFTAGDPSAGFSLVAFALLFPARRNFLTVASFVIGTTMGAVRIAQGGHFLSDVLFTALISVATALLLYITVECERGAA